mmetsp:Transcript_127965/g.225518  ORF Transcript_127965/g.225518 Transcript_127965/m.225518 type:complete len:225 (-) Transcript_127965:40-714(-)
MQIVSRWGCAGADASHLSQNRPIGTLPSPLSRHRLPSQHSARTLRLPTRRRAAPQQLTVSSPAAHCATLTRERHRLHAARLWNRPKMVTNSGRAKMVTNSRRQLQIAQLTLPPLETPVLSTALSLTRPQLTFRERYMLRPRVWRARRHHFSARRERRHHFSALSGLQVFREHLHWRRQQARTLSACCLHTGQTSKKQGLSWRQVPSRRRRRWQAHLPVRPCRLA